MFARRAMCRKSQLAAIRHFFEHYKDLERGKWVKVQGWVGATAAKKEIIDGVKRFRRKDSGRRRG
jgi:inorganic pyrophosphatase